LTPSLTPTPSGTPTPTPTETPTSTPTITPTPPPRVLAKLDTRLYQGPAANYPEQGWLVEGAYALIISQLEGGEWWYVETELGIRGWAAAEDVKAENDLSVVPIFTQAPPPAPTRVPSATPAPLIGPLILDEVWPAGNIVCAGRFEFDVWIRAHGGTGVYTYLVDDETVAQDIVEDGTTVRLSSPGPWLGMISVISGGTRIDREMLFSPADWCDGG
jgi:hypothetical protein